MGVFESRNIFSGHFAFSMLIMAKHMSSLVACLGLVHVSCSSSHVPSAVSWMPVSEVHVSDCCNCVDDPFNRGNICAIKCSGNSQDCKDCLRFEDEAQDCKRLCGCGFASS